MGEIILLAVFAYGLYRLWQFINKYIIEPKRVKEENERQRRIEKAEAERRRAEYLKKEELRSARESEKIQAVARQIERTDFFKGVKKELDLVCNEEGVGIFSRFELSNTCLRADNITIDFEKMGYKMLTNEQMRALAYLICETYHYEDSVIKSDERYNHFEIHENLIDGKISLCPIKSYWTPILNHNKLVKEEQRQAEYNATHKDIF